MKTTFASKPYSHEFSFQVSNFSSFLKPREGFSLPFLLIRRKNIIFRDEIYCVLSNCHVETFFLLYGEDCDEGEKRSFNNLTMFFSEAIKFNGSGTFSYWEKGKSFSLPSVKMKIFSIWRHNEKKEKFIGSKVKWINAKSWNVWKWLWRLKQKFLTIFRWWIHCK